MADMTGYEKKDVKVKSIIFFSLLTISIIAVFLIVLNDFYLYNKEKALQERDVEDIKRAEVYKMKNLESEILNNYKVLDENKGIYSIPVEKAKELILKEYSN